MTFADLTIAKETLFPSRYSNGYKYSTVEPNVIEVPIPEDPIADDECCAQIKVYVAEIQSCAHKFTKKRTSERLEALLSSSDSLSAFLLDVIGDDPTGTDVQGSGTSSCQLPNGQG